MMSYDIFEIFWVLMHPNMEQNVQKGHFWLASPVLKAVLGRKFHQKYKFFGKKRDKNKFVYNSGWIILQ